MITSTLPRWVGDAEPGFVLDLARELGDEFDVELIAPHAPGAARSEVLGGVPVTRFRYWWPRWQSAAYQGGMSWRLRENPLRIVQLPFFFASLAWVTVRRLRRQPRIDLIHAHWLIPQGAVALLARRFAGRRIPVLCTSHGGDIFGLRGGLMEAIKRRILRGSDSVTVVSHTMARQVRLLAPGTDPTVVPMGTDLSNRFTPSPRKAAGALRRLIFVGRLVPGKGLDHLLDALGVLHSRGVEFSAEIVGHGPLADSLCERSRNLGLEERVHFTGPISHDQLAEHYQRAGIAVFPFNVDQGFGLVLVEAMGCGCTVIASDIAAVRDVIQDGVTGLLVPPGDTDALASVTMLAIEDFARAQTIAENGRRHALAHFDWSVARGKFTVIYRSLAGSVVNTP